MMKHPYIYYSMIIFLFSSCSNKKQSVDLILYNAKVYTVDENFSIQDCIVIDSGRIVETGSKVDIISKYDAKENLDLKGKFVYPGFIDAHCHFYGYALHRLEADFKGTKSFNEVLEILINFNKNRKSEWLMGRGWDQNDWEVKEFPDNKSLDSLFPDIPVFIKRVDGHAALVNTIALKKAGIAKDTKVEGGKIELRNGKPTGILIDNALDLVSNIIPKPSDNIIKEALSEAAIKCFEVGLTSLGDAGLDKDIIELIDSMQKSDQLKMRIYVMLSATDENYKAFLYNGKYKTPYLNVRSIKLYADGALGSRGACLLKPYADQPDNYGIMVNDKNYFKRICLDAMKYGYQINTHCIGDSALRVILDVYGSILKYTNDLRWRIEHAQVVTKTDLKKFARYSIIPAVNTVHATSDMYWAESRLGSDRIRNAYAYKSLLMQNGWLCNGSDFPVEDINPLYGFYAAVSRKDLAGYPLNGFQKENSLNRQEAMKSMTIWAARSFFEENEKGSIEVGKYADLVVLDEDIMVIPENKIPLVKVLYTYISGKAVYQR